MRFVSARHLLFSFISLLIFLLFSCYNIVTNAEVCQETGCVCEGKDSLGRDRYCCQNGEWCCTGFGCPSDQCDDFRPPYVHDTKCYGYDTCCLRGFPTCTSCIPSEQYYNLGTCSPCSGSSEPSCTGCPSAPTLASPLGTTINDQTTFTFSWTHNGSWGDNCSTKAFRLQVDNNSDFSSLEYDSGNLSDTTYSKSGVVLQTHGLYYWRVIASNGNTCPASISSSSFTSRHYPPTAEFNTRPTNMYAGTRHLFNVSAADSSGSISCTNQLGEPVCLANLMLFRRQLKDKMNTTTNLYNGGGWVPIVDGSPSGWDNPCSNTSTCVLGQPGSNYKTWTPQIWDEGIWQMVVNAHSSDDTGSTSKGRCTGNPENPPDWNNCNARGADAFDTAVLNPPTASITCPAGDLHVGQNYPFSNTAFDSGGNLVSTSLSRRLQRLDGSYGDVVPFILPGVSHEQLCANSGTCTNAREWKPTRSEVGTWRIYANAFDALREYGGRCSGTPATTSGVWSDCGSNDSCSVNVVNDPPTAGLVAGQNRIRNYIGQDNLLDPELRKIVPTAGFYNARARDTNYDPVYYWWTANSCTLLNPMIKSITIKARADCYGDCPVVEVYRGAGQRSKPMVRRFTVSNPVFADYLVPIGNYAHSLDIVFTNDAFVSGVGDRNLFIQSVLFEFYDGSYYWVYPHEQSVNGNYVYYDKGVSNNSDTWFDGYDVIVGSGAGSMYNSGSLRIPVPIRLGSSGTIPRNCTLISTARDPLNASVTQTKAVSICGQAPGAATLVSPIGGEWDVEMPVSAEWTAPSSWGNTCVPGFTNSYIIYATLKSGSSCPVADVVNCQDTASCSYAPIAIISNQSTTNYVINTAAPDTEYCWYVQTRNGEYATNSTVEWFETIHPLINDNWFTSIKGSVYIGSLTMSFPSSDKWIRPSPWAPPFLVYESDSPVEDAPDNLLAARGAVYLDADTYSSEPEDPDNPEEEEGEQIDYSTPASNSGIFYANSGTTPPVWLSDFSGNPPSNAEEKNTSCNTTFTVNAGNQRLNPAKVYKMPLNCLQQAVDSVVANTGYRLRGPGVVVIYVTGNGTLEFTKDFKSRVSDNYKVLFVTGPNIDVKFSRAVGFSSISSISDLDNIARNNINIEAGFVVKKSFIVDGIMNDDTVDPEADPDKTLVLKGVVISDVVHLRRTRGLGNGYPSEIFIYDPIYLKEISSRERDNNNQEKSGLTRVNVDWMPEDLED